MPKSILSPWTLAVRSSLVSRAAQPGGSPMRKDSVVLRLRARVRRSGLALTAEAQPLFLGGQTHSRRWRGGRQWRQRPDSGLRGMLCRS